MPAAPASAASAAHWKQEGNDRLKAGNPVEALKCYTKGVRVASSGPLLSQLYSNRAHVFLQHGREEDAFKDCANAIQQDAYNAKAYWRGATAALKLEKLGLAKNVCERGLAKLGGSTVLKDVLAKVQEQLDQSPDHYFAKPTECEICLSPLDLVDASHHVTLFCEHTFHEECVTWLRILGAKDPCIFCRADDESPEKEAQHRVDAALTSYYRCKSDPSGISQIDAARDLVEIVADEPSNPAACGALGLCYIDGCGVPVDVRKGVSLFEKGAAGGLANAQYNLGVQLHTGDHVKKDQAAALELFEKAAAQGHLEAQMNLGMLYYNADSVPLDKDKAADLFEKAAAQGHAVGQLYIGEMIAKGEGGRKKDKGKSAEFWERSVAQGNAEAQAQLSYLHRDGDGVRRDPQLAVELMQKAADQGHEGAQFNLGQIFHLGNGVPVDKKRACELWAKSAAQGNALAQNNLGLQYQNGDGVPKNLKKAAELWQKAAVQGHQGAQYNLSVLSGKNPSQLSRAADDSDSD